MSNTNDLTELRTVVSNTLTGIGVTSFYRLEEGEDIPAVPYAVFWFDRESLTGSDDANRIRSVTLMIQLVTASKDLTAEAAIEAAFTRYRIDKTEDYDTQDHVFVETFTIQITQKIRRS